MTQYLIFGEPFVLEHRGGKVWITHPHWSLMGIGDTELAARADLLAEACELAEVMGGYAVESLDSAAQRLREFVVRVAAAPSRNKFRDLVDQTMTTAQQADAAEIARGYVDLARVDATTAADIERHAREDDEADIAEDGNKRRIKKVMDDDE